MDKDANKVSTSHVDSGAPENAARRKLLKAGAAAVPVMVTIKSTSAQAAGLTATPATWGWGGGKDKPDYPSSDLLGSIACIQNVDMPWNCDGAVKDVCDKNQLDYDGWCRRRRGYSSLQEGGVMPATYQPAWGGGDDYSRYREHDDKCDEIWGYFWDGGRTNFWPGCKFDVSKDRHCTYVQICMSTACWDSIKTAVDWGYDGKNKFF